MFSIKLVQETLLVEKPLPNSCYYIYYVILVDYRLIYPIMGFNGYFSIVFFIADNRRQKCVTELQLIVLFIAQSI